MAASPVFVHIPRTGGIGLLSEMRQRPFARVWHTVRDGVPPRCKVFTLLRNETARYCSEWQFYGATFSRTTAR